MLASHKIRASRKLCDLLSSYSAHAAQRLADIDTCPIAQLLEHVRYVSPTS
jgi:hypothetical protein